MKENWIINMKKADFNEIGRMFHISPITARVLRNRGLTDPEQIRKYLNGTPEDFYDPHLMKDMDRAVSILQQKITEGKKIRIIGDYDIDGVNSTYILLKGLKRCGAIVDTDIPDRIHDGYGINEEMVLRANQEGIDTIVTCDNGISESETIDYANSLGMTVIVTDHHQVPYAEEEGRRIYTIPKARAVIDPHQESCAYPYKNLCGAGVAFKVVCALYESFGVAKEETEIFLENVAIATIGDVVDLEDENRIFVKEGLRRLNETKNAGLRALIELCGLSDTPITAFHIGFVIGPCINAGGRLDTAKRALEMLIAEDFQEAGRYAGELVALNASRKSKTLKGVEEAVAMISERGLSKQNVLVLYLPDVHESIVGIVAGRIRELYYRPVLVLTDATGENDTVKGSGRSIEGYSMFEELSKCKDLLLRFGGHPMAAGLSLDRENVEILARELNANFSMAEEDLCPKVEIDMLLPFAYATEELVKELELIEPSGKANRKPLFALKDVSILSYKVLGKNRNAVKMQLRDPYGAVMDGLFFGNGDEFASEIKDRQKMDITYYPSINEFRGVRTVQAVITHFR